MNSSGTVASIEDVIRDLSAAATGKDASQQERHAFRTLADELLAVQSIYCADQEDDSSREESFKVVKFVPQDASKTIQRWQPDCEVRLELRLPLDWAMLNKSTEREQRPSSLRLSILLPRGYPASAHPPQLQLLDRFLGAFEIDSDLSNKVQGTFELLNGQKWEPDASNAVLFEGCESVKVTVEEWFAVQARIDAERRAADTRAGAGSEVVLSPKNESFSKARPADGTSASQTKSSPTDSVNEGAKQRAGQKKWTTTEAVVDRKSTFIGHAVRVDKAEEVPFLLRNLLSLHPRLEKATHPLMHAWVCAEARPHGSATLPIVHRDNDDDGETAAGGRLAHLLDALVS